MTVSFQAICADVYTVSKSTVSRIVRNVSNCFSRKAHQFIKFPEEREDIRTTEDFFDIAGFPNILGAVKGSLVPIKSPGIEEENNFICRKGYHAMNVQGICMLTTNS